MPGHVGCRLRNGRSPVIEDPDCFMRYFLKTSGFGKGLFLFFFLPCEFSFISALESKRLEMVRLGLSSGLGSATSSSILDDLESFNLRVFRRGHRGHAEVSASVPHVTVVL